MMASDSDRILQEVCALLAESMRIDPVADDLAQRAQDLVDKTTPAQDRVNMRKKVREKRAAAGIHR